MKSNKKARKKAKCEPPDVKKKEALVTEPINEQDEVHSESLEINHRVCIRAIKVEMEAKLLRK